MIISINAENLFEKFKYPSDKNSQLTRNRGIIFNLLKKTNKQLIPNIIPDRKKLHVFPLRLETRQGAHSYCCYSALYHSF